MACSRPIPAFQLEDGSVVFVERKGHPSVRSLSLPCGQCALCRRERARQWAVRCIHESKLYDRNCFVTLTYDDRSLPVDRGLFYPDFQLFMKRLRRRFFSSKIRFYMCGEYGDQTNRPHYHVLLFNFDFADKLYFKKVGDSILYTSKVLQELWPSGSSLIGAVTFESASYVAHYCMSVCNGFDHDAKYLSLNKETGEVVMRPKEFGRMSLRPGIGAPWFARFMSDVYPRGEVVVNGRIQKPPRYYDKIYAAHDPDEFARLQYGRYLRSCAGFDDNSDDRLAVKEQVALAGMSLKSRPI